MFRTYRKDLSICDHLIQPIAQLQASCLKDTTGFVDDVISVGDTISRNEIEEFLLKASNFHPTIKFTAEISETETRFLDKKVYKGVRFDKDSILDVRTHFKPAETFQ